MSSLVKQTNGARQEDAKGSDITQLDFATFFDDGPHATNTAELENINHDNMNESVESEQEASELGVDDESQEPRVNGGASPGLFFSEEGATNTKLVDVVRKMNDDDSNDDIVNEEEPTEPEIQPSASVGSMEKGATETEMPPNDIGGESFGEFVADFDADATQFEVTKNVENDAGSAAVIEGGEGEGVTEPETTPRSGSPISADLSNHSEEEGVDGERSQEFNSSSRSMYGSSSTDASVSEEEAAISEKPSHDNSTTVNVATEEDADEAMEPETTPSTESTIQNGTDFETYQEVAALLLGMNREQIDWTAAQRMVSVASRKDAILAGFKALLLHPEFYKDGRLQKHESDALRAWIRAQDLGLLDLIDAGNEWAQLLKGMFRHAEDKDYASAREYYELAAEQGNALAQYNLGVLYSKGSGVRQNYKRAKEYYELAAQQGHANAQCSLGDLYLDGKQGVSQDCERAVHYFELAVEQGHAWAQYKLGLLYKEGTDVKQDYKKAKQYYELAVEQGFAMAQCNLGSMYVKGTGVPIDYERARHLYELAVVQGCAEAQNNLGHLYKNGMGVPQDYEKAKRYYALAAKQGFAPGQSNLDTLDQASCVIS